MTPGQVKICGLSTPETLEVALNAGADLIGLVRFGKSPRHVSLEQGAALHHLAMGRAKSVVLTVDADDAELDAVVSKIAPDMLQLHGSESPEQVALVAARYQLPVIKAIGVAVASDLVLIDEYQDAADILLIDAKPPPGAELPGGNGVPFDWTLLQGLDPKLPLMLSGGLTPDNVAEAIRLTGVRMVDVSSGVEKTRGVKDIGKIEAFIREAQTAWQ